MALYLVEGPAGAGKSEYVSQMLEVGEIGIISDLTMLWAALGGYVRGPDGKYPVRLDDDPALELARYVQAVAVRQALDLDADVAVTTSRRGQESRWRELADRAGRAFAVRTIDPGREVVEARLSGPGGQLSQECQNAINRWYENESLRN